MHATDGVTSRIDDPEYFLSGHNGHKTLKSEMRAAIDALWLPIASPDDASQHIMHRFPGRCEWLIQQLAIDREALPVPWSQPVEDRLASLNAQQLMIIFPDAHLARPASLFGHTLLLVQGAEDTTLTSLAINFAAHTDGVQGFSMAWRGLFGQFDGRFSLLPYYQKVLEYRDMDQRDIWEYRLAVGPDDIRRLLLHVYDLRGIASDYYFLSENCSYNLLWLLDVMRPGQWNLVHQTKPWVIPTDTIKLLYDEKLIASAHYRPSRAQRVKIMSQELDLEYTQALKNLFELDDNTPKRVEADSSTHITHSWYRKSCPISSFK